MQLRHRYHTDGHFSTIAKVIWDRGEPSEIQTILTSTPIVVEGWTDLVDVQLYHCLLVVNIGECSSDWESSGRLVIMDINTLRQYHIPASTDDAVSTYCQSLGLTKLIMYSRRLIRCIRLRFSWPLKRTSSRS